MKKIEKILILLFFGNTLYATQFQWIDMQVEAIKAKRETVVLSKCKDPFIYKQKVKPKIKKISTNPSKEKKLFLSMIMNASAFINNNWYAKNDTVENYILIRIDASSVTLQRNNTVRILSLYDTNQNLTLSR